MTISNTSSLAASFPPAAAPSPFRTVFSSDPLRREFVQFLRTIFYQLDDQKVLAKMDEILADQGKPDAEIYEDLAASIDQVRKPLPPMIYRLQALSVLQRGMGRQAARLLANFRGHRFSDYLEIYFRRYIRTLQKTAKLSLNRVVFSASNRPAEGSWKEKIEAGALFSRYPYRFHANLNDPECGDPDLHPEQTHKPLGEEVGDASLDLITCLGGLHHVPPARLNAFVASLHTKLRPGGVLLLRDHDIASENTRAIASVVHSFVNAENGTSWEIESREIRNFQTAAFWEQLLQDHHFTRISPDLLILPQDPTRNGMMAFVKEPTNLAELTEAARYRKDSVRPRNGTRATWIEWGNVRYSKQFAEFVRTKHAYAFDYLGHLKQHCRYFTAYLRESRRTQSLSSILLSEDFAMNLFILSATIFQCAWGYLSSLPSACIARMRHGASWRNATDLTALERYEAAVENEYSRFIDHTPFYMFPYLSKIKGLWSASWNGNEGAWVKCVSLVQAAVSSVGLGIKAAICAPIRAIYRQNGQYVEPETVSVLVKDPENSLQTGNLMIGDQNYPIRVIHQTADGHKLVLMPRYRPFTEWCKQIAAANAPIELYGIGDQHEITLDIVLDRGEATPLAPPHGRLLYEMERLQDAQDRRYATYEVPVEGLTAFVQAVGGPGKVEYVHE